MASRLALQSGFCKCAMKVSTGFAFYLKAQLGQNMPPSEFRLLAELFPSGCRLSPILTLWSSHQAISPKSLLLLQSKQGEEFLVGFEMEFYKTMKS